MENSVTNTITWTIPDEEDNKEYTISVDLKDIKVSFPPESADTRIMVTNNAGIVMRYPSAKLFDDTEYLNSTDDTTYMNLTIRCVDKLFDKENVYTAAMYTDAELKEWLENLDVKSSAKVRKFLDHLPGLHHEVSYTNSKGTVRKFVLNSLPDFFTF